MVLPLKLDGKYEKGHVYHPRRLMGRFKAQILSGTLLLTLLAFFISRHWIHKSPAVYYPKQIDWSGLPVKGALVVLARENEVHDIRGTMIDIEDRLHTKHKYPWVILGDQPYSPRFQALVSSMAPGRVYFGQTQTWHEPSYIDIKKVEETMSQMANEGIYRGESLSWRKMARYNVGYIADHPLLQQAEYYWKVQPRARYLCDIKEDPFVMMKSQSKKLAYAIAMVEDGRTIPSLWTHVKEFIEANPDITLPSSSTILPWMLNDEGTFNRKHIWNNFMIISLDFMRSKEYRAFFEHLEHTGGFFYERWSDAPVQTFAAALFLKRDEVHFMQDFGYSYSVGLQCPADSLVGAELQCICDPTDSFPALAGPEIS